MRMKCMGCLNHILQHDTSPNPSESPTTTTENVKPSISAWGGICMSTGRNRRCWNTLYMYEVDLLWVWSGWVASIITYSMIQVKIRVNLLLLILPPSQSRYQLWVASLWALAAEGGTRTLYICMKSTSCEYKSDGVHQSYPTAWYKSKPKLSESPRYCYCYHWDWKPSIHQVWSCILMATSHNRRCQSTLNMIKLIYYEYEMGGGSQS
jgi:hypothetical protein